MVALRFGHACNGGDRHRVSVDYLRCLFVDEPGDSTRLPAAHAGHPHGSPGLSADKPAGVRPQYVGGPGRPHAFLQGVETLSKRLDLLRLQSLGTSGYDAPATHHERLYYPRVAARRGNVIQGAQEPQADCSIRGRIMANLFKCRIEEALGLDPWNDDSDNVRRSA